MTNKLIFSISAKIAAAAAAVFIVLTLFSCGAVQLPAPAGLTASDPDPDNPNRIEISWLPVDGADIYYVYRSGSPTGTYTDAGFSVTSSDFEKSDGTTELRYSYRHTFADGEGGTYYYRVTAASNADITAESSPCAAVAASTYSGTWGDVKTLGTAGFIRLAADNSALYAVYSGATGTDAIAAQKYAEDPDSTADVPPMIWTALTGSPGTTDGGADGAFSVFLSGGELYTVFRDASSSDTDFVSMKYYHDTGTTDSPSFSWTAVGSAKFNADSTAAATELSGTTVGFGGNIYAAFLEGTAAQLYKYNSTTDAWFESDISGDITVPADTIKLVSNNNTLYVGYEDTTGSSEKLYLRAYDDSVTALQSGGLVVSGNIDNGNADFVSGGGELYAVYTIGGTFGAKKYADGAWTALSNTTGMPSAKALAYGPLDAHWYNGYLYVFYLGTDDKGHVKYYDENEGWLAAENPSTDVITGTIGAGDGSFQLASSVTRLYAGYIEGGQAKVRILE